MVVTAAARYPGQQQIMPVFAEAARDARFIDAAALAVEHLGDEQYANMIMVGAAYQCGALPIAAASIERAIQLNAVAVAANLAAFRHGRHAIAGQAGRQPGRPPGPPPSGRRRGDRGPRRARPPPRRGSGGLPGRVLRRPLRRDGGAGAGGRSRDQPGSGTHRRRGPQSLQAHGVQGRVRGRAALPGSAADRGHHRPVRRGCPVRATGCTPRCCGPSG